MFWGLSMDSEKRYTQTVAQSFHISQASIDIKSVPNESSPTQIILEFDNNDYLLATLSKNAKVYQVPLDLNFQQGDRISFRSVGPGIIHLTGYHVFEDDDLESRLCSGESDDEEEEDEDAIQNSISDDSVSAPPGKRKKVANNVGNNKKSKLDDSDDDDDDDEDEEEDDDDDDDEDITGASFLDMEAEEGKETSDEEEEDDDDDEEESEDDEESDEEEEKPPVSNKKAKNQKNASVNGIGTPGKKDKLNQSKKEIKTPKSEKKTPKKEANNLNQSKQEKTPKEAKTPKQELKTPKQEKKTPKGDNSASPVTPGQKKVLEGGLVAEELKIGSGPVAKPGKMAQVYYVGRLKSNNKQFDASTSGPGFKFRVGRGEVIRGWDVGVAGMRVGGKRRLTVPASLGYGPRGAPPAIPANATLMFEVELRGVVGRG